MITHLKVENLRTWRELDADLTPVTFVIGDNNSGKTNLLRGLKNLYENTGTPLERMATFGESSYSVEATHTDGHKVKRARSRTFNGYVLTGPDGVETTLGKVGSGTVEDVVSVTGIRPVRAGRSDWAIHWQGVNCTGPLDLAPSDFSALLADISGAGEVAEAARIGLSRDRELGQRIKQSEQTLAEAQEEESKLAGAEDLPRIVSRVRGAQVISANAEARLATLQELVKVQEALRDCPTPDQVSSLSQLADRASAARQACVEATQRRDALAGLLAKAGQVSLIPTEGQIGDLDKYAQSVHTQKIAVEASTLSVSDRRRLLEAWQQNEARMRRLEESIANAEKEFSSLLREAGKCPLCGREVPDVEDRAMAETASG